MAGQPVCPGVLFWNLLMKLIGLGFAFLGFALGTQLYIVFFLFVCRLGASSNRSRRFDKCPALLATGSGFSTLFFLLAR